MSPNRLVFLLVALVLLAGAAIAIRGAFATSTNVSTATSVSPGSARPPELHNSAQAPDPAGYWDTVSPASSGLNQGTVRPRRCTVPLEGGTWLATGTC